MRLPLPSGSHHGTISSSRRISGFVLTETFYSPGLTLPPHSHELACFCLVLGGSYEEAFERTAVLCRPSTVLFRPPEEAHTDRISRAGGHCFLIEPDSSWMTRVSELSARLDRPTSLEGGRAACLAMQLYREFQQIDDVSSLAIEGLAWRSPLPCHAAPFQQPHASLRRGWSGRGRSSTPASPPRPHWPGSLTRWACIRSTLPAHSTNITAARSATTCAASASSSRVASFPRRRPPSRPWRWLPASPARPTSRRPSSASPI
jgi:hypothetical protein